MFPHAAHEQQRRPPRAFKTGRWHSRVRGLPETLSELPVATLADEMETPGEGQVRALLTIAGNPALTTPDAGRLDGLLAELELMVCVDPYLNATTRHADVILPPPSVLEKSHYDLAFTALSVRDVANFSPPVFEREPGSPSEFQILVRLAAIAAGLGADADPDALADATIAGRVGRGGRRPGVVDPRPRRGRDRGGARRPPRRGAAARPAPPHRAPRRRVRRASRRPLARRCSRRHPHGIDFGPLEPRLPDALATESGRVELAPPQLVDDLARLERALAVTAAGGMVLVGRRQLRTANSWTQNVQVLVRGKDSCVAQLHPGRRRHGSGSPTAPPPRSARPPARSTFRWRSPTSSCPASSASRTAGATACRARARRSRPDHAGVNVNILTDASVVDPISGNAVLNGIPVTVAPA